VSRLGAAVMLLIVRARIRQLWSLQVRYSARHRYVLRELDRQLEYASHLIERLYP